MSVFGQMLSGVRKIVLIEDRIDRLEKSVDRVRDEVDIHERRVGQLETVIFGPVSPDRLRLPR